MNKTTHDHVSVCICTYKRPQFLGGLLGRLREQATFDLFDFSVIVVDNDASRSAESLVSKEKETYPVELCYYVEPEKNISAARNLGVLHAKSDLIALIDDDELPERYWLATLFKAMCKYRADGIFGQIKAIYEGEVSDWVRSSGVISDVNRVTGAPVPWTEAFTSNVLLKKELFFDEGGMFNKSFGLTGGGDVEFFKRKSEMGYRFIGCDEAVVFALIVPQRCTREYMVKRAFLEGAVYMKIFSGREKVRRVLKSCIALLLYSSAIPVLLVLGKNRPTKYVIKLCHHLSMVLACFGLILIKDRTVLESIEGQ